MMQCCGTWNPGCCHLKHENIVSFDNLKTKYSTNEDILVEYTLHGHVQQASTRDWLGIFPRGWSNLQQYLTFEYALVAPRAASSSNRTIIFPRVFHQEASPSIEYQLVYVSREIQVLATSSYFRFVRDEKTQVLRDPRIERAFPSETQEISSLAAAPHTVLSDQSLQSIFPSRTIPSNPRLPRNCRSCGRPRDSGCGLAAGRARFLATDNASLAERVLRLERDLALAEGARCGLAERLKAYERFVAEMLRSLATKRVVKITDASGKEIVLQQLPPSTASRIDPAEVEINNNGESRNVEDDIKRRAASGDPIQEEKEIDISTNDRSFVDEYLSEDRLPVATDDQANRETGELREDRIKLMSNDVETQTLSGGDSECIENSCRNQNQEKSTCNDRGPPEEPQALEIQDDTLKTSQSNEPKESIEKGGWTDGENEESSVVIKEGKVLQSKPSAIVIQGNNVKFAIIRY